jgi:hypothetical protein
MSMWEMILATVAYNTIAFPPFNIGSLVAAGELKA